MSNVSRRSFLKLVGAAAPAVLFPAASMWAEKNLYQGDSSKPNVIILLFDAMSARDLSVYGYPRPTSPNMERFAERATVYHSHNSGGNYTVPGTASLLTGCTLEHSLTFPYLRNIIPFHPFLAFGSHFFFPDRHNFFEAVNPITRCLEYACVSMGCRACN